MLTSAEGSTNTNSWLRMLESTTQKELSEALAGGYKFLEINDVGERVIVLGRRKEAATGDKMNSVRQSFPTCVIPAESSGFS